MYQSDKEQEKKEILKLYKRILGSYNYSLSREDKIEIRKAFNFAQEAHKNARRKSGEPYIYHPLEVAYICAHDIGLGVTSIVSALLHDVVEDTDYTIEDIKLLFGEKVSKIVAGLTKINRLSSKYKSLQFENFKKIILTLSDDIRVILIKLADRLHNMRTLNFMPEEKRFKITSETRYLYAPLANRLGLYSIKSELEDLILKYIEPIAYNDISNGLKQTSEERNKLINHFISPIKEALDRHGYKYRIVSKERSISSIWKKMKKNEISFNEVLDVFVIKIIIDTPLKEEKIDCLKVYSIVTDYYKPNLDRLRDWISIPKSNGYEAIHTTVMSDFGQWVELQIKTERMNEIAEKGYVAIWKNRSDNKNDKFDNSLDEWMKKISENIKESDTDTFSFVDDFKLNLFSEEIFIFTPKGDLINMPKKSTVLDFAYNIHSEIGNKAIAGKVNRNLVPINHVLKSGDQVEIITSKKQTPKPEWLDFVVSARTKSKIKAFIKEEKKKDIKIGKEKIQEVFKHFNLEFNKDNILKLMQYYNIKTETDLYYDIANDKINLKKLKSTYKAIDSKGNGGILKYLKFSLPKLKKNKENVSDIIIDQIKLKKMGLLLDENPKYEISKCCNPISGDDIVGIVEGNTVKIHKINCLKATQLMSEYGNNIVKVRWSKNKQILFLTGLKIIAYDKIGLTNEIIKIISVINKINIQTLHIESKSGIVECLLMIYVYDTSILDSIINDLKKIDGVKKVLRIDKI